MVLHDDAGIGLAPQSIAKLASDRRRDGLSPAVTRNSPADSTPTHGRCQGNLGASSLNQRLDQPVQGGNRLFVERQDTSRLRLERDLRRGGRVSIAARRRSVASRRRSARSVASASGGRPGTRTSSGAATMVLYSNCSAARRALTALRVSVVRRDRCATLRPPRRGPWLPEHAGPRARRARPSTSSASIWSSLPWRRRTARSGLA